ncbi:hypothetical protein [Tahibacter soli]|uniref:Uncharacterized protein n=1 Tax=Tahibacter soli TaxID=2983605 RepID=A0A9X3YHL2_9GAMM|nr:hypothetical protein [Tahibacter soli]MDC8011146.1 hypothetical protein [Tahibacter soli]MDC8011390.1 hypothetical protein [Tahibacter soli]
MYTTMFRLPRTRHPFLRAVSAVIGVLILAALVVFGFFAALALVTIGAVIWAARQFVRPTAAPAQAERPQAPPPPPGVIEGEFTVVRDRSTTR